MGRKTKLTLQLLVAGFFVMMLTTFLMTENYSLSSGNADVADLESVEDGVYTGSADGYNGPINVEVTVENGEITDVTVLSHADSPGISDPAFEGVPAAIVAENSTEVEVVSGATFTSNGLMAAVNNALSGEPGEASEAPVVEDIEEEEEEVVIEPSDNVFTDGMYQATVDGHNAPLSVVVTVEGGVITNVEVTEHAETDGLADPALENVTANIVKRNGTDVDVVSGATVTSDAIIAAVEKALGLGANVTAAAYNDGVYEATVDGRNAPLSVEVTVTDGVIANVVVTDHAETEEISDPAIADIPTAIVNANSTDVDVVTGASITSRAIMAAVDQALLAGATAYQVTVEGHNGPLTVVAEVTDGTITSVEVTDHVETDGLADPALTDIPAAIVENNATDVEVVSGASVTSEAIIEAVDLILAAIN